MKKTIKGPKPSPSGHVIGQRTFSAITAVEGIGLSAASRRRFAEMNKRKLSPDDQRAEVIRAYLDAKSRG